MADTLPSSLCSWFGDRPCTSEGGSQRGERRRRTTTRYTKQLSTSLALGLARCSCRSHGIGNNDGATESHLLSRVARDGSADSLEYWVILLLSLEDNLVYITKNISRKTQPRRCESCQRAVIRLVVIPAIT